MILSSDAIARYEGRGSIYNPMIEPVFQPAFLLGCELYMCVSVPSPSDGMGWQELGTSFLPGWLGSHKTPKVRHWLKISLEGIPCEQQQNAVLLAISQ